jgi:TP901 family phage tail tape measure protein
VAAGEKILRVIIAGDALGAVGALESLSHGLERAHSDADSHGGGIMSSLGGAAKAFGIFAVGATAAAGAIGAEIFHISSEYEQNLNAIQAFTHSTTDQMKSLENQLYSMSPKFAQMGQTVSDASGALFQLTKAGASSKDGMTELIPTMALAKATGTDYAESAKEMTRVLNAFGLQAKDATMVSDVLTNATHTSTQTLQDMADGLKYVSVAAHDYGIDLKTTSAVMAMYANAGIQGTNAGTAFRQMLLNLSAPTTKAKDAIAAIGLKAFDAQGHMRPLGDIFQQLQDKFGKGLDTHSLEKIAPYLKDIFGARGVEPILAAIKQGGGGLQSYIDLMNRTGEASAIASAKSKGLSGTFNTLKAEMESATQHLYMQVAPKLANFLNPFVESLPGYLSKASKFGSELFDAISNPDAASAKAGKTHDGMLGGLAEVGKLVQTQVIPALKSISAFVQKDVIPVVEQFGKVFVTQVLPFIARVSEDIAKLVLPILRDVGKFVKNDILPSLKQWGEFVSTVVIPKMEELWTKLQPILRMVADFIEKKIIPLLEWAWKQIQPLIKDLESLISETLDALSGLLSFLTPVVKWIIDTFGGPFIDAIKGFLSGVFQCVSGIIEFFRGLIEFFTGIFTGNWHKIWDGLGKILGGAWDAIYGLLKAVLFGKIVKLFVEGGKAIMDAVEAPFKWIFSRATKFGSDMVGWGKGMWSFFGDVWNTLWKNVGKFFSDAWDAMWKKLGEMGGKILGWLKGLPGTIRGLVVDAGSWLIDAGGRLAKGFLDGITKGAKGVWDWLKGLPGQIGGWLSDVGKWLYDAGIHMIEGFINGIASMAGKLKDKAVGVVKDAYHSVTDFLGISSPSRLFMEVGGHVGQGFINGIGDKTSAVHDSVVAMVTVPQSRFADAFKNQSQVASNAAAANARAAGQVWATAGSAVQQSAGGPTVNVTINVAGSIQAERDFARTMSTVIRDQIRQIGRQNGGQTGLTGIGV